MNPFSNIILSLEELKAEDIPRSIVPKIDEVIKILQSDCEPHLCKNRAMSALELVSENTNIQAYARTQLFNILSKLESS